MVILTYDVYDHESNKFYTGFMREFIEIKEAKKWEEEQHDHPFLSMQNCKIYKIQEVRHVWRSKLYNI